MDQGVRLSQKLAAIADPELRALRAAALLRAGTSDLAVSALAELIRLAHRRTDPDSAALEGVLRALRDVLDEEERASFRTAARAAGELEVLSLVSAAAASWTFDRDVEPWVDREMRAQTLGHRRMMARGHNRDRLARLMTDPDAAVIKNLLLNPHITEREVLIAAARRPARADVLEEIFRSPRWTRNRRVRRALALNPYAPPALASAALALLTLPDLREILRAPHIPHEVRQQAQRLIDGRRGLVPAHPALPFPDDADDPGSDENSPEVVAAAIAEVARLQAGITPIRVREPPDDLE